MKNRTVTVELLRSGPPHNQLLSPLTPYLGVCGESGADVVHVPYEQYKFDRRLRELRYEVEGGSEEELLRRLELLRETGTEMASVLGGVPGLAAALKRQEGDGPLLHLRLVISASELALLPWELARVPQGAGIPAESWLLLQGLAPVTLTRHIRSVPTTAVRWPSRLRLLVVTGDPEELPYQEHLAALGRAFAPWLPAGARLESDRPQGTVILENATVREVEKTCGDARAAGEPFTHVHVLAHGAEEDEAGRTAFGLYLRDGEEDGGYEVVSGERFGAMSSRVDAEAPEGAGME